MARKRADNADVTVTTPEGQTLDLTGLETADELNPALEALYAEMGQDAFGKIKVYIYKIMPETGKEPRVWEGAPGDYDLMTVAKRFGSADYRVKVHVPHSSGRIVIGGNTVFPILLDPAEDAKIIAMRSGAPVMAVPATPAQPVLTAESIAIVIAQAIKAALPAPLDPLQQMDRLAGVMQKLLPQHPSAPAGGGFMDTLKAVQAFMEVNRSMNPPVDGEGRTDVKGLALAKGIGLLEEMFKKSIEQAKPNPALAFAKQDNGSLLAPDAQSAQEREIELTTEQQEELEMLRLQIKLVNRRAKENVDPVKLVEEYYDDVPDDLFDLIVFTPNWFDILCANVGECVQYKEWYEKLRAAFIAKGIKDGDLHSLADGSLTYTDDASIVPIGAAT